MTGLPKSPLEFRGRQDLSLAQKTQSCLGDSKNKGKQASFPFPTATRSSPAVKTHASRTLPVARSWHAPLWEAQESGGPSPQLLFGLWCLLGSDHSFWQTKNTTWIQVWLLVTAPLASRPGTSVRLFLPLKIPLVLPKSGVKMSTDAQLFETPMETVLSATNTRYSYLQGLLLTTLAPIMHHVFTLDQEAENTLTDKITFNERSYLCG